MITIIKLTNGLEVIGEREAWTLDEVVLHKPLQINYRHFVNATPSVWFVRYMLFAQSDTVSIDTRHIISQSQARDAFASFYRMHVDFHYVEQPKYIDEEISGLMKQNQRSSDDMQTFLEQLSVEGAPIN